jgi:DNA-binding NtrC family response regulator
MNILVIDDEVDICEVLELALSLEGYGVKTAHNRESALRLALEDAPAVILLDYRMPDLDARDFVDQLKAQNIRAAVVLMTGANDAVEKARKLGFEHVLCKPFDMEAMLSLIRKLAA